MQIRTFLPRVLQIAAHVLGWALLVVALDRMLAVQMEEVVVVGGKEHWHIYTRSILPHIAVSVAAKAALVYGAALWVFPAFWKKKRPRAALFWGVALLSGLFWLEYEAYTVLNQSGYFSENPRSRDIKMEVVRGPRADEQPDVQPGERVLSFWNMALYALSLAGATAWFFVRDWRAQDKQLRALRELQTSTELNFLKLQIHPHFLFNTLNNLFSLAQKNNDDETAGGIARLAELMRYLLHESNKTHIPLEQELVYLRSFIELARMRYSEAEVQVTLDLRGDWEKHAIPPMLLIPFVENAFKHGVRVGGCSHIALALEAGDGRLVFSGSNPDHAVANHNPAGHAGIGLDNVRKRLALLYGHRATLDVSSTEGVFRFTLSLPLP